MRVTVVRLFTLILSLHASSGFVVTHGPGPRVETARAFAPRKSLVMYMPSSTPTSQTPPMTAQKILTVPGVTSSKDHRIATPLALSPSVLASCDTISSFRTAHGLLSPETVMRLEKMFPEGERSSALSLFLSTFRKNGPISCLDMLSNPDILPHLTTALRDLC